jgi:hypothetical protein
LVIAPTLVAFTSVPAAATDVSEQATFPTPGAPAQPQVLGRVFAAGRTAPSLFALTSVGYGYTEAVLDRGDTHNRAMSSLTIDGRPVSWLGFALRFDGRYDWHRIPGQPNDDGLVGDPRFYVRVDTRSFGALRAGARFGLWLPGGNAPSLALGAASPEVSGTLTYAAPRLPLWLTANLGYRLDRSAHSASDAARLSDSDRLSLEVSASNEVLLGLGGVFGRGALQGFAEASGELATGHGAPRLSQSPLLIGGGARVALNEAIRLEAAAEGAISARPPLMPTATLVPVPPRLAVWLGLSYRFGIPVRATLAEPSKPPAPLAPATPATITLQGLVTTNDASIPPGVHVSIGEDADRSPVRVGADGRFVLTGKVGESISVHAEAPGYQAASRRIAVTNQNPPEIVLTLAPDLSRGQIRGLVRSLDGAGLDAQIGVEPSGQIVKAESGRFQVDVAPGTYEVTVEVKGYEMQRRRVQVEPDGVTLLNVDLQAKR